MRSISIFLHGYDSERKSVFPIRVSREHYHDHMELLYIEGEVDINRREGNVIKVIPVQKQHYVYIKDFNSFMYHFTKHKERKHFCMHCLQCFYSDISLAKHKKDCIVINGDQAIQLPELYIDKNGKERIPSVYFHNYHKQLPVPFVIYADFESITEKISGCQPSDRQSYTEKYQRHTACSFGYKVVCHYDKKYSKDVVIYRGEDGIGEFMKSMFEELIATK